jgi:hypothetical protein
MAELPLQAKGSGLINKAPILTDQLLKNTDLPDKKNMGGCHLLLQP